MSRAMRVHQLSSTRRSRDQVEDNARNQHDDTTDEADRVQQRGDGARGRRHVTSSFVTPQHQLTGIGADRRGRRHHRSPMSPSPGSWRNGFEPSPTPTQSSAWPSLGWNVGLIMPPAGADHGVEWAGGVQRADRRCGRGGRWISFEPPSPGSSCGGGELGSGGCTERIESPPVAELDESGIALFKGSRKPAHRFVWPMPPEGSDVAGPGRPRPDVPLPWPPPGPVPTPRKIPPVPCPRPFFLLLRG